MSALPPICPDLLRTISACGDPAFVVDEKRTIVLWNAAAADAFGRPFADVRGKPCHEVIAGIDGHGKPLCKPTCQKWALARRGAAVHNFDIKALPTHGVWANVSVMPVYDPTSFDPNGRLIGLVHVLRNVDRTKRLERTVREFVTSAEDSLSPHVTNGKIVEPDVVHLTAREQEVLRLVAHGTATDSIAEKLGISRHTARNHVASLLAKLALHSRVEAAAYAFEHDLA